MVAREHHANAPRGRAIGQLAGRLFSEWRRLLAAAARVLGTRSKGLAHAGRSLLRDLSASLRGPAVPLEARTAPLIALGLVAAGAGVFGTVLLSGDRSRDLAAAGLSALWGMARLPLMSLAAEAQSSADRAAVRRAWAIGLLPYAAAVVPALQPAAWAASAALAFQVLRRAGFAPVRTAWVLAWGYGSQAFATVAAWLVRNLVAVRAVLGSVAAR